MNKEEVMGKIKAIYDNEKFKQDAFFFCGFPSDRPNEAVMKVCKDYMEGKDGAKEALVAEFKKVLASDPEVEDVKNILNSRKDLQEILDNRENL